MQKILKKKKLGLVFLCIFLFGATFLPSISNAGIGDAMINSLGAWITGATLALSSIALSLTASLFEAVINISRIQPEVVKQGWVIVRDIANFFFIIALLFISIATILNIETYGVKRMLSKLIIAAVFLNFSYAIGTKLVEVSQAVTDFFVQEGLGRVTVEGKTQNISSAIVSTLKVAKVYQISEAASFGEGFNAFVMIFVSALLSAGVVLVAAFVIGAGAIIVLLRTFWIWLLLIVAPAAWALYAMPKASQYFDKWWSMFLKWVFFLPVYAFFLYLAMLVAGAGITVNSAVQPEGNINAFFRDVSVIIQYLLIIAILIGGLFAARSSGIAAAGTAIGYAKKLGYGKPKAWTWKGTKALGRKLETAALEKISSNRLGRLFGAASGFGAKIPVAKGLTAPVRAAGRMGQRYLQRQKDIIAKAGEKHKNLSEDAQIDMFLGLSTQEQLGMLKRFQDEGKIGKLVAKHKDKKIKDLLKVLDSFNFDIEKSLKFNPAWLKDVKGYTGKDLADEMEKLTSKMNAEDWSKLLTKALVTEAEDLVGVIDEGRKVFHQRIKDMLRDGQLDWQRVGAMAARNPKLYEQFSETYLDPYEDEDTAEIPDTRANEELFFPGFIKRYNSNTGKALRKVPIEKRTYIKEDLGDEKESKDVG